METALLFRKKFLELMSTIKTSLNLMKSCLVNVLALVRAVTKRNRKMNKTLLFNFIISGVMLAPLRYLDCHVVVSNVLAVVGEDVSIL